MTTDNGAKAAEADPLLWRPARVLSQGHPAHGVLRQEETAQGRVCLVGLRDHLGQG